VTCILYREVAVSLDILYPPSVTLQRSPHSQVIVTSPF
jgi:hypothetical protein